MEVFFKDHQYTIAAFAAFGTLASVIISLWLAWTAGRHKIKIFSSADSSHAAVLYPQDGPDLIKIEIHNKGNTTVRISNLFWRQPFSKSIVRASYGDTFELKPETIHHLEKVFPISAIKKMWSEEFSAYAIYFQWVILEAHTSDGHIINARIENKLNKALFSKKKVSA